MRHLRAGVHLSRTAAHRKALFANLVAALFTHDRIRTTDAKAKATRRIAERTITWARRLGEVLSKRPEKRTPEESGRVVHAVRLARRVVRDRSAVVRLFDEIAPRFLDRPGGYTRIVKLGTRPGDAAPMSLLELIPDEGVPGGAAQATRKPEVTKKGKDSEPSAQASATKGTAKGTAKGSAAPKASKAEKTETKTQAKASGKAEKSAAKKPGQGRSGRGK